MGLLRWITLNVNSAQVFRLGNLPLLPFFLFARRHPAISLVGKRLDESSRDPQWIAERRADPLAYKKVTFGYLGDIKALVKNWQKQIAPRVRIPTLIIQGEQDRIVSRKDCREFSQRLATPDKTFKTYPDVRHTTQAPVKSMFRTSNSELIWSGPWHKYARFAAKGRNSVTGSATPTTSPSVGGMSTCARFGPGSKEPQGAFASAHHVCAAARSLRHST